MTEYRNEIKYIISEGDLEILKSRIAPLLQKDPHAGEDNTYSIRSVYFDTYDNNCYYDNENGNEKREKFRIRMYNLDSSRISLELKQKDFGMTKKTACLLDKGTVEKILNGEDVFPSKEELEKRPDLVLLNKFMLQKKTMGLKPKVIVEYERIPFIYGPGNVRITFDKYISGSSNVKGFFERDIGLRPIMPLGSQMLEVKFDEFLPDIVYNACQIKNLQQTTFSKYYYCRKFCG